MRAWLKVEEISGGHVIQPQSYEKDFILVADQNAKDDYRNL